MSPALQRKPALGPEADGELILAISQGEGLVRDCHRKQQLLCCTFLQQQPRENKNKTKQQQLSQAQQAVQSAHFPFKNFNQKTVESLDVQTLTLLQFLSLTFTDTISIFYMTANFQLRSDTHPPHVILTTIFDIL